MLNSKLQTLYSILQAERPRLILWVPVLLGVGILLYFSLHNEPPMWAGSAAALVSALAAYAIRKMAWMYIFLVCVIIAGGFSAAQLHVQLHPRVILHEELKFRQVRATIADIDVEEEGKGRLVLERPVIEGVEDKNTPPRIRVTLRNLDPLLHVGDEVELRTTLYPLMRPVAPGGFDFGRYLYFEGLGAIGYAVSAVNVIMPVAQSSWGMKLTQLRLSMAERMRARMGEDVGSVAAALTVGEQNAVPEHINTSMRDSGLYHILSISGIHLALASGIVFFAVRLLLSLSMRVALKIPVKKIAACCALLSAVVYLLISGAPVPAQRSFIMVAFVFIAVLVDRKGISIYTLAWAATFLLLMKPDSILGVSFQMSFAATLAIVAFYERYAYVLQRGQGNGLRKIIMYVSAVMLTSLAATIATAPFVIYHFNRLQLWGVLSNMVVEPLAAFWIMPGVVLSFLLWPLGLEQIGFYVLESGIHMMLWVGRLVAALPYASITVPSQGIMGLSLGVVGMLWVALWRTRIHVLGWGMMVLGLMGSAFYHKPDILLSDDAAKIMVRLENGNYGLLKGTEKSFAVKSWLSMLAEKDVVNIRKSEDVSAGVECEKNVCHYQKAGRQVTFLLNARATDAVCATKPEIIIASFALYPYQCVEASVRIDANTLDSSGAHAIYIDENAIDIKTVAQTQGTRPWVP